MDEYKKEIELIKANTEFTLGEIFDFEDSPYKFQFADTFGFYKGTLSQADKYGVENSYFFFYNDRRVNARAGKSNGFNIICINSGLQIWTVKNILEKGEINDILEPDFSEILEYLDNPINSLMYQLTMHFTFYHELAHLIQKSEYLEAHIYERPTELESFELTRHRLELDADNFSGLSISAHIQQYAVKQFGDELDSKKMESLLVIFSSSLILYLLSFTTAKEELYYFKNSHPHPVIRTLNVIMTITHLLQQSPVLKARNISLNIKTIFEKTIKIARKIEAEVIGEIRTDDFEEILKPEIPRITEYLYELNNFKPEKFNLSTDVWNETLKNK